MGRTSLCWWVECTPVRGGWHFQIPTILRLGALEPSLRVVGSAQLGPDHLQGLKCFKEAEPLLRPPSESEFVAMSELLNGGGNR